MIDKLIAQAEALEEFRASVMTQTAGCEINFVFTVLNEKIAELRAQAAQSPSPAQGETPRQPTAWMAFRGLKSEVAKTKQELIDMGFLESELRAMWFEPRKTADELTAANAALAEARAALSTQEGELHATKLSLMLNAVRLEQFRAVIVEMRGYMDRLGQEGIRERVDALLIESNAEARAAIHTASQQQPVAWRVCATNRKTGRPETSYHITDADAHGWAKHGFGGLDYDIKITPLYEAAAPKQEQSK